MSITVYRKKSKQMFDKLLHRTFVRYILLFKQMFVVTRWAFKHCILNKFVNEINVRPLEYKLVTEVTKTKTERKYDAN